MRENKHTWQLGTHLIKEGPATCLTEISGTPCEWGDTVEEGSIGGNRRIRKPSIISGPSNTEWNVCVRCIPRETGRRQDEQVSQLEERKSSLGRWRRRKMARTHTKYLRSDRVISYHLARPP
jgi:hypothetical protein